ncbi:zinc finger protein 528 [Ixodes scapularis]
MVRSCCVPQCSAHALKPEKISFHRFPTEEKLKSQWISKLRVGKKLTAHDVVCGRHFASDAFKANYASGQVLKRRFLKPNAVPSENLPKGSHDRVVRLRKPSRGNRTASNSSCPSGAAVLTQHHRTSFENVQQDCDSDETVSCDGDSGATLTFDERCTETSSRCSNSETQLTRKTPAAPMNEWGHFEDCGGLPASSLHLEGRWNGTFAVKEEKEEFSVSTSEALRSGDAEDLFISHGHLYVDQSTSVLVKKEPEDAAPTSAGESVTSGSNVIMPECAPQLEGHGDNFVRVKEEILPTPKGASFQTEESSRASPFPLDLEGHWNNCVVKKEPADVEWQSSDPEESSSSLCAQEWDQGQQEEHDEPKGHGCRFCSFSSVSKSRLAVHECIHTGDPPFSCNHCQMMFTTKQRFNAHASTHKDKARFKCFACSEVFLRKDHLFAHEKIHAHQKSYKCDICGKAFLRRKSFTSHQNVHMDTNRFKCATCPLTFQSRHNLKKHLSRNICKKADVCESTDKDEKPFKCSKCPKSYKEKSHLAAHQRAHIIERPFKCSKCPKAFETESHLTAHEMARPFKCLICTKAFHLKFILTAHERIHMNEKPFKCPMCPKAFRTRHNFISHEMIHTDKRPFKCTTCPKSFQNKSGLTNHERIHTDEKPFECSTCAKLFRTKSSLSTHEVVHTDERPFKCSTCLKSFPKKSGLKNHEMIHTDERPFKCGICPKAFRRKTHLAHHETVHMDEELF